MKAITSWLVGLAVTFGLVVHPAPAKAEPSHAIAMHGEPALGPEFTHFPYANPDAPKGGRIEYAVQGSFDSVNPFIVQGAGARGLLDLQLGYNVFESLMQRSADEPFTLYPLVARSVETDEERTFVEFTLDPDAKFSDGRPIRPEDVIFTVKLLGEKGYPRYGVTARKIRAMDKVGSHGVRFTFAEGDRELPLILGLMPVLPEHAINAERFDRSTLEPMIGSGPYRLTSVRPGESLTLTRNEDYWARDKPSKRGFDNYDEIRITYFRDANALFEAFKKGVVDVQIENNAVRWQTGYDFPAATDGRITRDTFRAGIPSGMLGFVMNTRRPVFQPIETRRAVASLFDFEWANTNLFAGAYKRTRSFYDGSDLSSHGVPASEAEKALLAPYPDAASPRHLAGEAAPPVSDGTGRDRQFLKNGFDLIREAGYAMKDGRLVNEAGQPLRFEIMLRGRNGEEVTTAWQRTLSRLGIETTIRSVDDAQYQQRLLSYDFDVIMHNYPSSLSPGVEQLGRWGSSARDLQGTMNYAGAADPAIDGLIDALLNARQREDFMTAVRAYDRVLLSKSYVVPLYHQPEQWVARWEGIDRPETTPLLGFQLTAWWRTP